MTADRIMMIGCAALLVVSVFANQREGAQVEVLNGRDTSADTAAKPASPPTPDDTWNAQEATEALTRCITAALDEQGPDAPAFYYTDPHTERRMAIFCDAVRPVKVVNLERRFVP